MVQCTDMKVGLHIVTVNPHPVLANGSPCALGLTHSALSMQKWKTEAELLLVFLGDNPNPHIGVLTHQLEGFLGRGKS